MDQTAARPLFRRSRRPPEIVTVVETAPPPEAAPKAEPLKAPIEAPKETPKEAPPPAPPKPVFRHTLSAVAISKDEAFAYMRKTGEAGLARLRRGETLDDWRLVEIRPDAVVLEHGGERTEVQLRPSEASSAEPDSDNTARHDSDDKDIARDKEADPDRNIERVERIDDAEDPEDMQRMEGPEHFESEVEDANLSAREFADRDAGPRSSRRPDRGPRGGALERALRRSIQPPARSD